MVRWDLRSIARCTLYIESTVNRPAGDHLSFSKPTGAQFVATGLEKRLMNHNLSMTIRSLTGLFENLSTPSIFVGKGVEVRISALLCQRHGTPDVA